MSDHLSIPRLVLAGTGSGVGKTSLAIALLGAFRAQGLKVVSFKCGPDYLDPTYHARVTGTTCHNLDGWMMGRDGVLGTFADAARGADLAVIEGVMGLFDGASPTGDAGSTAEIAKWLEAPVVLAVNASGMSRTICAIAHGFKHYDPNLNIAGLIANQVGSRSHLDLLRKSGPCVPVLGGLPKREDLAFPHRHLGLRTADRNAVADELFASWAQLAGEWIELEQLLKLARFAPALPAPPRPVAATERRCRLGVARDEAFHFYYPENLRLLESCGAELAFFSPCTDDHLPEVDGLYIGGGYPEVHAEALANNTAMLNEIRELAASGAPIYGECGGLMYLCDEIQTRDDRRHAMLGLIPGRCRMGQRLAALGYVEVETQDRSILGPAGLRFRGHQFRYSEWFAAEGSAGAPRDAGDSAGSGAAPVPRDIAACGLAGQPGSPCDDVAGPRHARNLYSVRIRRSGDVFAEGYSAGSVLGSYVHAHWASNALVAEGLVAACQAFAEGRRCNGGRADVSIAGVAVVPVAEGL
jgi:cobyrinic acid a,c-diamide synthase